MLYEFTKDTTIRLIEGTTPEISGVCYSTAFRRVLAFPWLQGPGWAAMSYPHALSKFAGEYTNPVSQNYSSSTGKV